MLILDLWGISFHPAVVVGSGNDLLFNSSVGHCAGSMNYPTTNFETTKPKFHEFLTNIRTTFTNTLCLFVLLSFSSESIWLVIRNRKNSEFVFLELAFGEQDTTSLSSIPSLQKMPTSFLFREKGTFED